MQHCVSRVLCVAFIAIATHSAASAPTGQSSLQLLMPDVRPTQNDEVLCTKKKIDESIFITKFSPHAKKATAHHILLYACSKPGSQEKVWNCGEMAGDAQSDNYNFGPVCDGGQFRIVYAWAMDAPSLKLPKDVSFAVGDKTGADYLVLQVHYKNVSKFKADKSATDQSGVIMKYQTTTTPKVGGVFIAATNGIMPSHSTVFQEVACLYTHRTELHPFAFRTHAHKLGQMIAGYRVRNGTWTEIGRKSPQLPQMFYNVTNPGITIKKGDYIAARCVMKNNKKHAVEMGGTQKDEMCNFYMMYWVPADKAAIVNSDETNFCNSEGWPRFKWGDIPSLFAKNAPLTSAIVPGQKEIFSETLDRDQYLKEMLAEIQLAEEEAKQQIQAVLSELEAEEKEADAEAELEGQRPIMDEEEPYSVSRRDFSSAYDPDEQMDPVAELQW